LKFGLDCSIVDSEQSPRAQLEHTCLIIHLFIPQERRANEAKEKAATAENSESPESKKEKENSENKEEKTENKQDNSKAEGGTEGTIDLRPLTMEDLRQAKNQVAASFATEGAVMNELKQWNDLYGEGGSRKKQQLTYFL
jgi:hypothetical protein